MLKKKVVIIGAGCTGLSAAYTLEKQDVDYVVYEATNVIGGRCRSVPEDGYEFYAGAGSTEPQWKTTFQYLEELGLMDKVFTVSKQRYAYLINGKLRTVFLGGTLWDMLKAMPENIKFFFTGFPWKTYWQLIKVFSELGKHMKMVDVDNHNFEALAEISKMTTEEFVVKYGGHEALDYIFHPLLSMMVLGHSRDISVAHPIALFSLMKGMCSIEGGLGLITQGLYEKVKHNVQLNTPVQKVVIENGKVTGVELKDGFVAADQVIMGVDAVLARKLIPDLPEAMRKPLETCIYSSSYYYQFGLEKPLITSQRYPGLRSHDPAQRGYLALAVFDRQQ